MDFRQLIAESIDECPGDKKEFLEKIFKIYVAKTLEMVMISSGLKDRLPADSVEFSIRTLIGEFRSADIGFSQQSEQWYESKFSEAVQEILNDASHAHSGSDIVDYTSNLEINKRMYQHESGLYLPI